jgi:hypothetical protein
MKTLCDVHAYQETDDFIPVCTVVKCTYKTDNTVMQHHHQQPLLLVVVIVVVVVVVAAVISSRIIPLLLPTSTQNLSNTTVKILNSPDQTKINTYCASEWKMQGGGGVQDRIDLFLIRRSLTLGFLPSWGQAVLQTPPLNLLVLCTTCCNITKRYTLPQTLHWRVSYDSHN